MISPKDILKKYWGFESFRTLQEDIISSVLKQKDTLALLPTGGGKSICFQVPAMCLDGLCIVVSPLISLMKDQVENLSKKGINAIALTSAMSKKEIDIALDNCIYGKVKFLYVSPERLSSELFKERLRKMQVSLIAVDEAHCISQWGYDFRPSYLKISEIKSLLIDTPIIALTATATKKVVNDIQEKLLFKEKNVFQKSFERKNVSYSVLYESNKYLKLDEIRQKVKGTCIIYARNRRQTQDIAQYLGSKKHSAAYYHAGLSNQQRDYIQSEWIKNKIRIIVATNAFGMGIDKPDVRLVVHLDLPDSLEAYFQEAGRAGRDEKKAYAVLIYDETDNNALEDKIKLDFPELPFIKSVYQALGNYYQIAIGSGLDESFEFNISDFCQRYNFKVTETYSALKIIALNEYISLSEAFYTPSKMKFAINKQELYQFQLKNNQLDALIKLILRSYSGVFDGYKTIDEVVLAKRSNTTQQEIQKQLQKLSALNIIDYIPKTDLPRITFTLARENHKSLKISSETYLKRKEEAIYKSNNVIEYASNRNKCRSSMLLNYFDEKSTKNCGICDYCTDRHQSNENINSLLEIELEIKRLLEKKSASSSEIVLNLTGFKKQDVIACLRNLLDNNKVKIQEGRYTVI